MEEKREKPVGINTRYPVDVLAAIRSLARLHGRSLNGEVIWALRKYIAQQEEERKHEHR